MSSFKYDDDHWIALLGKATTHEEIDEIDALWSAAIEAQKTAALGDLRKNTTKMLAAIETMIGHIEHLAQSLNFRDDPVIANMKEEMGNIHAELSDPDVVPPAIDPTVPDPGDESTTFEGATTQPTSPPTAVLTAPKPVNSTNYADLADEYVKFFRGAHIRPSRQSEVNTLADTAWKNRARYQGIGSPLGIPWWFIAGIHQMESTYNFERHLHNGDRLTARTTRHPPGHPVTGAPPFTFEESATDALKMKGFHTETDWSLPRALYRLERYNGWGYRPRRVASPYLWGYSSIYKSGKYIRDHVFDANAVTRQCGVAVLLRELANRGVLTLTSAQFADLEPDTPDGPTPATPAEPTNRDTDAPPSHPFEAFWQANLSHIQHFSWKELLYKGGSNAVHRNNTDPPPHLYANVAPLVNALEAIRNALGARINLTSVYRSPAYNKSVGGVADSRHMHFNAADFQLPDAGNGTTQDWANTAKQLRADGVFNGGIGIYNTFVHIDTRGTPANWDER